jgi:trehalose 6-phosphate phosphatase
MPKYLFDHLQDIIQKSRSSVVLFLDYDGTLVDFQKKPDEVSTPKHIQTLIDELTCHPSITVIVITGRTLDNIRSLVDSRNIIIAGLHGFEIQFPGQKYFVWEKAKETQDVIKKIKTKSLQKFHHRKDVYIEDKKFTLAFHYRQVPLGESDGLVEQFKEIYRKYDIEKKLEVLHGDKVLEIRPRGWDKGKAVEMILKKLNIANHSFSLIYIGDDTTDEDAFVYLKDRGITIYVKNKSQRKTHARYYVNNPKEVYRFLQLINLHFQELV